MRGPGARTTEALQVAPTTSLDALTGAGAQGSALAHFIYTIFGGGPGGLGWQTLEEKRE
jgi:hypothetical protein